jgi:acetyl-CoA carboxylase biotin carboxyl carrier protein
LSLKKAIPVNNTTLQSYENEQAAAPVAADEENDLSEHENAVEILAPMVGTYYAAPAPDAEPYVRIGQHVEAGQTLCILEAMKLFNEIKSEFAGTILEILVENAQPVEFGQPLFVIAKD